MSEEYATSRSDIDLCKLTLEMSEKLGKEVALTMRSPGERDENGVVLDGMIQIIDPETGTPMSVDVEDVDEVLILHETPPDIAAWRSTVLADADDKASTGDTVGALTDVLSLLRAN